MAKPPESTPAKRIFIGYARGDARPVAEELRAALEKAGFEAFGDPELRAGQNWTEALDFMLTHADGAVIVITPAAFTSEELLREARVLHQRASTEPDFPLIPLLAGDASLADLAVSQLRWLADFQVPTGPSTEARVADAVASLSLGRAPSATPRESAAASAAESSYMPAESAAPAAAPARPTPAELPAMSRSTSNVVSAAGSRAGNGPVDASVVLVAALHYASETSLPGVTSALLAVLADRQPGAGDPLDRLDAVPGLGPSERSAAEDLPVAELAATPPLSRLLARAADCAQRVSGDRRIHLRHLVAATVLADDPPLRPELLAELDVTAAELRQIVREAARQETSGEPQEVWDALLPAEPLHLAGGIDTDRWTRTSASR